MVKQISLNVDGYWRDVDKVGMPKGSGVYFVYSCDYDAFRSTVILYELLYIGEAKDVQDRILNHEKYEKWKREAKGKELCFSCAMVASTDRERAEAALIYYHKPPVNTEYVNSYPFADVTISLSGQDSLLQNYFTVHTTK